MPVTLDQTARAEEVAGELLGKMRLFLEAKIEGVDFTLEQKTALRNRVNTLKDLLQLYLNAL